LARGLSSLSLCPAESQISSGHDFSRVSGVKIQGTAVLAFRAFFFFAHTMSFYPLSNNIRFPRARTPDVCRKRNKKSIHYTSRLLIIVNGSCRPVPRSGGPCLEFSHLESQHRRSLIGCLTESPHYVATTRHALSSGGIQILMIISLVAVSLLSSLMSQKAYRL
jgi:hypothetical protein